jgi:hypothetical protein
MVSKVEEANEANDTAAVKEARAALSRAIVVAAEVMGSEVSTVAAEEMARDLAEYPSQAVLSALKRCQREVTGKLSLAAIRQRIEDGHVGVEEAWALCPRSEAETVVWTDEIAEAFESARSLIMSDIIAARMAFRDAYGRAVSAARSERRAANWLVSLGHDRGGRIAPLRRAVALGRLAAEDALRQVSPELPGYQALAALAADNARGALGDGGKR